MNKKQQCLKCGGTDFKYYDGLLGYEAYICRTCGFYYDHDGVHEPAGLDNNSTMYVPVDQDVASHQVRIRNSSMELFSALKEALHVLNEIPNTKIRHEKFKDSYQACSYFSTLIKQLESAKKEEGL